MFIIMRADMKFLASFAIMAAMFSGTQSHDSAVEVLELKLGNVKAELAALRSTHSKLITAIMV